MADRTAIRKALCQCLLHTFRQPLRQVSILQIIERPQALALGMTKYFTGRPCKHGHISERYVSSFQCYECSQQPEYKDKKKVITKKWVTLNPQRDKDNHRAKYDKNYQAIRERIEKWRKENLDRVNMNGRIRKLRMRSAGGKFTRKDVESMLASQKGLCVGCGKCILGGYHIDHIVPVKKGGTSWPSNLQLLCAPCNHSKSAKDNEVWLAERARMLLNDGAGV